MGSSRRRVTQARRNSSRFPVNNALPMQEGFFLLPTSLPSRNYPLAHGFWLLLATKDEGPQVLLACYRFPTMFLVLHSC